MAAPTLRSRLCGYGVSALALATLAWLALSGENTCRPPCAAPDTTPPAPPAAPVVPSVATSFESIENHTTYQLRVELGEGLANLNTIYGSTHSPLSMPPSYQVMTPFGVNYGGINPALWTVYSKSQYDSWLTVGITTGNSGGRLIDYGVDFDTWTADTPLYVNNGNVSWLYPADAPAGVVVVAQITVPTGTEFTATMGVSGRTDNGAYWNVDNVNFHVHS